VILTAIVFVVIQQLEGNFLMPKIQGQSLHVHPVLVFLSVIIGGGLGGLVGVLLAVPALAMLRVLFDFFRARLRIREVAQVPLGASEHTASPHSGELMRGT
jgi:predicted PurR-regulated permease PerM